jgi:hypothetical protein
MITNIEALRNDLAGVVDACPLVILEPLGVAAARTGSSVAPAVMWRSLETNLGGTRQATQRGWILFNGRVGLIIQRTANVADSG